MRPVARLLAVLLLLAGPAGAAELDVQPLPQESSVERVAVSLVANLGKEGGSCERSSLTLEGPELPKPLTPELEKCKIQGKELTAVASFPRLPGTVEVVLQACTEEGSCESPRKALPESAGTLKAWPLILQKVETARGELVFQSRELPADFGQARTVRVVEWDPSRHKPAERPPSLAPADPSGLTLTIPMNCSSLELSRTELTRAVFEIRDAKGAPLPLFFEGALPLCGQPPSWFSLGRLWMPASGAFLALLGLMGGLQLGKRFRPNPASPTPADLPPWLKDSVQGLPGKLETGFQELKALIKGLERPPGSDAPPGMPEADGPVEWEPEPQPFATRPEVTGRERDLLQTVNDWWVRGDIDTDALASRVGQSGAKLYVSFDIDETLQRMVGRTFSFQPSNGPAGWVWYPLSKGDALAVPADPFLFHAGNMIEILRLLFDGIGEAPKSFRFFRVHKACRLRVQSPGSDRYQLVEKGYLELADRSGARIPGPQPPTGKARSAGPAAPPRKEIPKALESPAPPALNLREIEERVRWVLKDELGKLPPPPAPQPADNSREAIDALRARIENFSADLRKLDGIQKSLEGLAFRMESLKRSSQPSPLAAVEPPAQKAQSRAPLPPAPPATQVEAAESLEIPTSEIPPSKGAVEPAPGEFLQRVTQALPALVTAASEAPGSPAPSDYLRRLFALWKDLHQTRPDQNWKSNLVHLQVVRVSERERIFSVHPVQVYEDFREARCRCGDLPEAFLLQIFLAVRNEGDLMAIAMASSNMAERFAEGYSLLTGDEDPRDKGNLVMTRPAVLQSVRGSSESWRVVLPMEVASL